MSEIEEKYYFYTEPRPIWLYIWIGLIIIACLVILVGFPVLILEVADRLNVKCEM